MHHLAVAGQHGAVVRVARVPLVRLPVDEHLQTGLCYGHYFFLHITFYKIFGAARRPSIYLV